MKVIVLPLLTVLYHIIEIYSYVVIASVIMTWLYAFEVVNPRNQFMWSVGKILYNLTEPILGRIRRFMPNLGGIDLSAVVLILLLLFLRLVISEIYVQIAVS